MNKINKIVLFMFLLLSLTTNAQNWQWAKKGGSISKDRMANMCVDNSNNVYIIGSFGYTGVTLPSANYAVFDNDTVYNNGVNQLYLVKYSSTGNVVWAKSMGGDNPTPGISCNYCEAAHKIYYEPVTDALYMTGSLYGTGIFGNDTLSGWGDGVFFTKIDMNGNFIWAKYLQKAAVTTLASDTSGNIYMAGAVTADSATFDSIKLPAGGFIAKYSPQGTCWWAKKKSTGVLLGKLKIVNNNIFIAGYTLNDTASVDTSIHYSTINNNGFVAKLDSSTNLQWIKYTSSSVYAAYGSFIVDTLGNIYIAGRFQIDVTLGDTTLTNTNTYDLFFAKYDSLGNFIWAKQANATNQAGSFGTTNDVSGDFHILGRFTGTITFDSFNLTSTSPTDNDYFIVRFDSSGICLGLTHLFTEANLTSIAESTLGEIYITGEFSGVKTFGSYPLTGEVYGDVYVAKMDGAVGIENARMANTNNTLLIYANPNQGTCNIKIPDELLNEQNLVLTIYDVSGKIIQQQQVQIEQEKIKVNIEAEAKGVYNVTLGNAKKMYSGKIVFE